MMTGYRNRPEETAQTIRDGFVYTGDIGYLDEDSFDEDSFVFITDRKKDVVFVKGFNVFPREVEEVIHTHPMVDMVGVVGVPDPRSGGERLIAFVVPQRGEALNEAEISVHARQGEDSRPSCERLPTRHRCKGVMSTADQFRPTVGGPGSLPSYAFGSFVWDTLQHALLKEGKPVALTPKTYDTLLVLVRNSGRMLAKEEHMNTLWPNSFVKESNLTQQVSMIRRTLGESASDPRYIALIFARCLRNETFMR